MSVPTTGSTETVAIPAPEPHKIVLPSTSLFNSEPYLLGGTDDIKTSEPVGIFMFIIDSSDKTVAYDNEFKKYATLEYSENDKSGNFISTGELGKCD